MACVRLDNRPPRGPCAGRHRDDRLEARDRRHEPDAAENIPRDVACVINTHLHFDHCGGNRLFPGVPIHVQARELADARSLDEYTPEHTDGHQVVVVETDAGRNVLGGDVGTSFGELGSGATEGQRRVLELGVLTWLSHVPEPKIPERSKHPKLEES